MLAYLIVAALALACMAGFARKLSHNFMRRLTYSVCNKPKYLMSWCFAALRCLMGPRYSPEGLSLCFCAAAYRKRDR